jgi:hypothetical protein
MGIKKEGGVISFFDESFGGECEMTEGDYLSFWETALCCAQNNKNRHTILLKPKRDQLDRLSDTAKNIFLKIKEAITNLKNVYIIDSDRWSFIEAIGVSDVVVTQGMTSSSTIAIICGIEALYLDEFHFDHAFSRLFKDRIVFDDPQKLLSVANEIASGRSSVLNIIPQRVLRDFDAYDDDRAIERFRIILSGAMDVSSIGGCLCVQ